MEQKSVRKTYKYKLLPMPHQQHALATVVLRCRTLYNIALEQRRTWWGRGQCIGATYHQQATEWPELKAACPDSGEVHSQVRQDVLRRVDKTYPAFFRRVTSGQAPALPASKAKAALTPSPRRSTAMAWCWTVPCSASRRSAVSRCGSTARCKAPPSR